jgi:hypothetical protein
VGHLGSLKKYFVFMLQEVTNRVKLIVYRISHWETWPHIVKYIFLSPAWLWFCFRARSLWFFSASNPTLTFGGFEGEDKKEMYAQLPDGFYPKSMFVSTRSSFDDVLMSFSKLEFTFPVAVKPDVGMMGLMFRKIESMSELHSYHSAMTADYIIQSFSNYPIEVSVFYYRYPGEQKGCITGLVRKEALTVTGDGRSTLNHLIESSPRAQLKMTELKRKHELALHRIIPAGEKFYLSQALNLSRGGKLVSLEHEIDNKLLQVFDHISHHSGHFYYGRYDVQCASIEDLKAGRNFTILEFNGAGAEPHHVYSDNRPLRKALLTLVQHWQILYRISSLNNKKGVQYWNFTRGLKHMLWSREHFKSLHDLDIAFDSMATTPQIKVTHELGTIQNESANFA